MKQYTFIGKLNVIDPSRDGKVVETTPEMISKSLADKGIEVLRELPPEQWDKHYEITNQASEVAKNVLADFKAWMARKEVPQDSKVRVTFGVLTKRD
jgi:hypothetical protein